MHQKETYNNKSWAPGSPDSPSSPPKATAMQRLAFPSGDRRPAVARAARVALRILLVALLKHTIKHHDKTPFGRRRGT